MSAHEKVLCDTERVVPPTGNDTPSGQALDGSFRFQYAIRLGLALAAGAAASTLTVYALLAADLGDYAQGVTTISSVRSMVFAAAALSGLIQLTVGGLLVSALALVASHKIAGPTVRLVRVVRAMADGVLPEPVHFRGCDQTGHLATHFKRVCERIAERHAEVVDQLAALCIAHEEIEHTLEELNSREECSRMAREICQRADTLARRLQCIAEDGATSPAR